MPSLRGRLFKFLLQNRHLLQFQLKREISDWSQYESILRFRRQVEEGAGKFGKLPKLIEIVPVDIAGLYAEWILPTENINDKVILYFHGGGYISGTCKSHRAITAKFVKESRIPALLFEYRLAPENPYPAALDDALKAYNWLLAQGFVSAQCRVFGRFRRRGFVFGDLTRSSGPELPPSGCGGSLLSGNRL